MHVPDNNDMIMISGPSSFCILYSTKALLLLMTSSYGPSQFLIDTWWCWEIVVGCHGTLITKYWSHLLNKFQACKGKLTIWDIWPIDSKIVAHAFITMLWRMTKLILASFKFVHPLSLLRKLVLTILNILLNHFGTTCYLCKNSNSESFMR